MDSLAPFGAWLGAIVVGVTLSALTWALARRAGLAPMEARLVETLKDNAEALEDRVNHLEGALAREQTERRGLELEVRRLRDALADLATENAELRRSLAT